MAEEHRCQAQGLCANNCGFFGSPATQNLCSKCYRDLQLKEQQSNNAKLALDQTLAAAFASTSSLSVSSSSSSSSLVSSPTLVSSPVVDTPQVSSNQEAAAAETADVVVKQPNRCLTCRKRVGLMGFKCRCGMVFCGSHRYPEQHDCEFDFKSLGKDQIAKANPVIKTEKLEKI